MVKLYDGIMFAGMIATIVLLIVVIVNQNKMAKHQGVNLATSGDYPTGECAYKGTTLYDSPIDGDTCAAQCNENNPGDPDFSCCASHCTKGSDGVWKGCADVISTNCRLPIDQQQ